MNIYVTITEQEMRPRNSLEAHALDAQVLFALAHTALDGSIALTCGNHFLVTLLTSQKYIYLYSCAFFSLLCT